MFNIYVFFKIPVQSKQQIEIGFSHLMRSDSKPNYFYLSFGECYLYVIVIFKVLCSVTLKGLLVVQKS